MQSPLAEGLLGISDSCVDVVATRSVLIYVADKPKAFFALHRVLRPGGRISLFEPINRLMFPEPSGRFWGYDLSPVAELVAKVNATFTELEDPAFRDRTSTTETSHGSQKTPALNACTSNAISTSSQVGSTRRSASRLCSTAPPTRTHPQSARPSTQR